MARDCHNNTIVQRRDDGSLAALGNVQVTVIKQFDGQNAIIYQSRLGAAQGPTAASGGTGTNPFTTGNSGSVEFWADPGEYSIRFHDLQNPARFADYAVGWNSVPAAVGALPSNLIAPDGGLQLNTLNAQAKRQFDPIGTVISWWRPSAAYDAGSGTGLAPPGWEICDGRTITESNHEFGNIGSVVLPDMRGVFELGANIATAHGLDATNGDTAANAPGIAAAGGTNTRSFSHSHTVNSHSHGGVTAPSDNVTTTTNGDHTHVVIGNTGAPSATGVMDAGIGSTPYPQSNHTHGLTGGAATAGAHWHGVSDHSHDISAETPGTNAGLSAAVDIKPRYVGLLRLMKVRRN